MLRVIFSLIVFLSFNNWGALSADAQSVPPSEVIIETENYSPTFFNTGEGTYHYDISWQGISVAGGKIEIDEQLIDGQPMVQVHAQARTSGAVAALYRLRHNSAAVFNGETFKPLTFHSVQSENRKVQYRQIYFLEGGVVQADRWKKDRTPDTRVTFTSSNTTYDPISSIFYARSLPMKIGVERSFDIYSGRHRFLITLKVESLEWIKIADREIGAYKIVPTVKKLTDLKDDKKLRGATIWISADEKRHILRLESEVWVGSVVAELTKFEPKVGSAVLAAR